MKVGKLPESVLSRSVFKKLNTKRPEVIVGPGEGEDCAAVQFGADEIMVMTTDPITGTTKDIGKLAVNITVNDLASAGAEPVGIMLTILLTPRDREIRLKEIMDQVDEACREYNIQVMGGHTEVTEAVNQILVSVTGVGKCKKDGMITTSGAKPNMDLVLTKWIGLEGTSIIAKEHKTELMSRLPESLVDTAADFDRFISVLPESKIATAHGVAAMHDVTEGGIFGALWEMGAASEVGIEVNLAAIPVRQETIEVCEFFGVNPYELISSGSMLIACENGKGLVEKLEENNIPASLIGRTTAGNDRVIVQGEERRFLEPPKPDQIYSVS